MACVPVARLVWHCVGSFSVGSLQASVGSQQSHHWESLRSSSEGVLELEGDGDGDSVPRGVSPQPRHYTTSLQRNTFRQKIFTTQIQPWGSSLRPHVGRNNKRKNWWKILSGKQRALFATSSSGWLLWNTSSLLRKPCLLVCDMEKTH